MRPVPERPLYIFDLDGTLALTGHRQHLLDRKDDPKRWERFFRACDRDMPNHPVIRTMERLRLTSDIWIWSGRSDLVRATTIDWLVEHTTLLRYDVETALRMREHEDFTPDDELKLSWLQAMPRIDRDRLVAVFDDRDKVVAMWRAQGVPCFQVAHGDF